MITTKKKTQRVLMFFFSYVRLYTSEKSSSTEKQKYSWRVYLPTCDSVWCCYFCTRAFLRFIFQLYHVDEWNCSTWMNFFSLFSIEILWSKIDKRNWKKSCIQRKDGITQLFSLALCMQDVSTFFNADSFDR